MSKLEAHQIPGSLYVTTRTLLFVMFQLGLQSSSPGFGHYFPPKGTLTHFFKRMATPGRIVYWKSLWPK